MYANIFATEESEKWLYFALCIVFHVHNSRHHWHRQCQLHDTMTPSATPQIMHSRAASVVRSASSDSIQVQVTTKCFSFRFDIIIKTFFLFFERNLNLDLKMMMTTMTTIRRHHHHHHCLSPGFIHHWINIWLCFSMPLPVLQVT